MIRFLFLIIFLSLIYFSAIMIGKHDATLSVGIFDYVISVSFLLMLFIFIFIASILTLGIRFVSWIISIPFALISRIVGFKKNHQINLLLDAYADIVMCKNSDADKKLSRLGALPKEYRDHELFIKALASKDSSTDAYRTYDKLKNKAYHDFAAKNIITTLFKKGMYDQALKFIEGAELEKSKDPEMVFMLTILYAELNVWDEFLSQVKMLKGEYKKETRKISELYTKGAKFFLEEGKERKALEFLEKALEYDPASMDAIEIFCTLNNSQAQNHLNLPILESAFSLNPSFELFELYYSSASMSSEDLYSKFESLVDAQKYRDVLLSIAAYLKLYDKVDSLLSCKI